VDFPCAPHNDRVLHILDPVSERRRDGKVCSADILTRVTRSHPPCYCSTTQFICSGAFNARISDPLIGGTYITVCVLYLRRGHLLKRSQLLNTVVNLGGTWPKFFVLRGTTNMSWFPQ
jgi:Acetyl-coenzyme A transporter 1